MWIQNSLELEGDTPRLGFGRRWILMKQWKNIGNVADFQRGHVIVDGHAGGASFSRSRAHLNHAVFPPSAYRLYDFQLVVPGRSYLQSLQITTTPRSSLTPWE